MFALNRLLFFTLPRKPVIFYLSQWRIGMENICQVSKFFRKIFRKILVDVFISQFGSGQKYWTQVGQKESQTEKRATKNFLLSAFLPSFTPLRLVKRLLCLFLLPSLVSLRWKQVGTGLCNTI